MFTYLTDICGRVLYVAVKDSVRMETTSKLFKHMPTPSHGVVFLQMPWVTCAYCPFPWELVTGDIALAISFGDYGILSSYRIKNRDLQFGYMPLVGKWSSLSDSLLVCS